jgi:O-antigen/teichoic acid export membrane protein
MVAGSTTVAGSGTNTPSAPAIPLRTGTTKVRGVGINSTAVFIITVVVQLIGYVSSLFLAKGIGAQSAGQNLWGEIQLYMIIATSLNMLGELRLSTAYVFFVARGRTPAELARTFLLARTAMVAASGLGLWLLARSLNIASTGPLLEIFGIFMILPILWSCSTVYTMTVTALGDSLKGQIPVLIESVVRTGALVYVALQYAHVTSTGIAPTTSAINTLTSSSGAWTFLVRMTEAYALGAVSSTVYTLSQVLRYRGHFHWPELRSMFRFAWPLMGSLGLLYLTNSVMPIVVAGYFGTRVLNFFNAANGFRILALALPAAVIVPLFPHLTGLHSQREYELVRDRTWRSLRFTAMLVVPAVVGFVVYRVPFLLLLYGTAYASNGQIALAILVVSAIPMALSQIIGTALNAIGYQRLELYLTTFQVIVLFGTVGVLFPPFSLGGALVWKGSPIENLTVASVALLASSFAAILVNSYFMRSLMSIHIQPRPIATIIGSAAAAFAAVSLLNRFVTVWHYDTLVGALLLGFLVYSLVLIAVGELSREDVGQLGRSIGLPTRLINIIAKLCWRKKSPPVNPAPPGGARAFRSVPPALVRASAVVPDLVADTTEEVPDRPNP